MFIRGCPLAGRAAFLKVASLDFYRKRPRRLRRGGRPHFFPKKWGERRGRGYSPGAPRNGGSRRRWAVRTGRKPTAHCRPPHWLALAVTGAPAEAQRSGFGGESFPAKRRQWRIKRAGKKERRDWRASLARESQCRDGSKGTVEGVSFAACGEANDLKLVPTKRAAMHGRSLPCLYSPPPPWTPGPGPAGPGGFPTAFDIKSGAPAGQEIGRAHV